MKLKSLSLLFLTIFLTSCSDLDKTEQNDKNTENTVSVPESSPEGGKENES